MAGVFFVSEGVDVTIYMFFGQVRPVRADITHKFAMKFSLPGKSELHELEASILLNEVSIVVETDTDWEVYHLRNIVSHALRTELAILGFLHGYCYSFEINRLICHERKIDQVFGIDIPILSEIMKKTDDYRYGLFIKLKHLCTGPYGAYFSRALIDLRMAMAEAEDTAFYCYRAIESLRNHCVAEARKQELSDHEKWRLFRESSKIDRNDIMQIKSAADPLRHGHPIEFPGELRGTILVKTWEMVISYVESTSSE